MTSLVDLQRHFIQHCLTKKTGKHSVLLANAIDTEDTSAQGLMGIYKNNAHANITNSLSLTYPVIKKLVGDEFFSAMCREFIQEYWPISGNMDDYGSDFALFLSSFKPVESLLYLPDVAELEWFYHQCSLADELPSTDWTTLNDVADVLSLKFIVPPSVKLLVSEFPIHVIWQVNQDDLIHNANINDVTESDINVKNDENNTLLKQEGNSLNATYVLIAKQQSKSTIMSITHAEYLFIDALKQSKTFEEAIVIACAKDEHLIIDNILKKFIDLSVIVGFASI